GSAMLAETALSLGFYISFSGVLTFKNSEKLREIASAVPMDRLLVETDAPFLAPVPYRGKRNEPAFVAATAQVLAAVKGVTPLIIAAETSANALRLFSRMPAPATGAGEG
ncbi:MAG: TatD family hydrolase, partial [Beijerinckiaceae bacterium]|nr:TatD family hydrolase [Beijerinckiaceae bacterium]